MTATRDYTTQRTRSISESLLFFSSKSPALETTTLPAEPFAQMNDKEVSNLLSNIDYDISGCLINCTNNGKCKLNMQSNKIECSCVDFFFGSDCRSNRRICSNQMQCLNSGSCIDIIEFNNEKNTFEFSYQCNCSQYYYGERCQYEVDLCQNKTCSSNGFCKVNETKQAVCNCFKFFSGENCEITSNELVVIKKVITVSSIVAIVVICTMFLTLLLNDITSLIINYDRKKHARKKLKEKEMIKTEKLIYKN